MTVLVDFPVTSAAVELVDPTMLRTVVRGLSYTELQAAIDASGAELARGLWRDLGALWSMVEAGVTRVGLDEIERTAVALDHFASSAVRECRAGRSGVACAEAYNQILGGRRRADVLCLFASELRANALGLR